MITLQALLTTLDELLNVQTVKDFCPNGLQVEGKAEVAKIATAVSTSLETIDKAIEAQVDALIVHHGLFWDRAPQRIIGATRKKIGKLLDNGISLLAYHLPLDLDEQVGNNWVAARNLGLSNCQPFTQYLGMPMGVKGELTPIDIATWVKQVEAYYGQRAHTILGGPKQVSSAVIFSGGGHKEMWEAVNQGIDCLITGSFDEPNGHGALDEGIHFIAVGHAASERVGPKALKEWLVKEKGLDVIFLDDSNPF